MKLPVRANATPTALAQQQPEQSGNAAIRQEQIDLKQNQIASGAMQHIANAGMQYLNNEDKDTTANLMSDYKKKVFDMDTSLSNQDYYSQQEAYDMGIDIPKDFENKDRYSASQMKVFAHSSIQKEFESVSKKFNIPENANSWSRQFGDISKEDDAKLKLAALATQKSDILKSRREKIGALQADGDYSNAQDLIKKSYEDGLISDAEYQKQNDKNIQLGELKTYDDVISNDDIHGIDAALKVLRSDDYYKHGALDSNQRRIQIGMLQYALNRHAAKLRAAEHSANTLIVDHVNKFLTGVKYGSSYDKNQVSSLAQEISDHPGALNAKQINDYNYAVGLLDAKSNLRIKPLIAQRSEIDNCKETIGGGNFCKDLKTQYSRDVALAKSDPMQLGRDTGIVDLKPINFSDQNSVNERIHQNEIVKNHYNPNADILTQSESKEVNNAIANMKPDDALNYITTITHTAGSYASDIFRQINSSKPSGMYMAAQSVMRGDSNTAREIIVGSRNIKILNDNKEVKTINDNIQNEMRGMLNDNPDMYSSTMQAAKAVAAFKLMSGQDIDYGDIVDSVIGPNHSFNGRKVILPKGMDYGAFKTSIDNLDPSKMKKVLTHDGAASPDNVVAGIHDGRISLINSSDGKYTLWDNRTNTTIPSDDGSPYTLDLNSDIYADKKSKTESYRWMNK